MSRSCKCGGTLRRTDIVGAYNPTYKRVMYSDTDNFVAHWKCDKCGATREQRKRQPRKESTQ